MRFKFIRETGTYVDIYFMSQCATGQDQRTAYEMSFLEA
ncbi:MAG: hypothetical protein Metus_1144 [Candidatus Methanosuratincola subterraneus]|uniref:Uncharacterized protein n=1 Tax=Methanosuratincola subterraneus TaxID=2593994 RepID=A0A3S3RZM9_METS7|nr:MAG: hypothetical protein Metus_1144 [Candidatus Methanosuratincola subterraneus]